MLHDFLANAETSLTYGQLWDYLTKQDLNSLLLLTNTIPDLDYEEDLWGGIDKTGAWVWIYDPDAAAVRLHEFIYGN